MKELNTYGDWKSLALKWWRFQILLFTSLKYPAGIEIQPLDFSVFSFGMRVQCSFQMGMKFQGIFLTGDDFLADISTGYGPTSSVTRGGVLLETLDLLLIAMIK